MLVVGGGSCFGGVAAGDGWRGGQAGDEASWVATGGAILAWAEAAGLFFAVAGGGFCELLAVAWVATGKDAAG